MDYGMFDLISNMLKELAWHINEYLSFMVNKNSKIYNSDLLSSGDFIVALLSSILANRALVCIILLGMLFILTGLYISIYVKNKPVKKNWSLLKDNIKYIEALTNTFPLKLLSYRLDRALSYFILNSALQRVMVSIFTLIIPIVGIILYVFLKGLSNLWYTRLITFILCITLPYYIFTLVTDYMKYSLRLKIPLLIDSFRSSFIKHCRIKPALRECSMSIDKSLGRIMSTVSDSSDLNESLGYIRNRLNDTWFNIFILLLINYRENGGELISQLYKLNRSITRCNSIEKKRNKRLIWYEIFTITASVFSLPAILAINKMILGINIGMNYSATASFARLIIYSLLALIVVRLLRKL